MVFGPRRLLLLVAPALALVVSAALVVLIVAGVGNGNGSALRAAGRAIPITVHLSAPGPSVPYGFLGLSLEYPAVEAYAGTDPSALDPVFEQLVRNLNPGQAPVLRIGGDSTDRTWWPTDTIERPPGVDFAITERWLQVTRALARAFHARLIVGLNLEADSPALSAAEADALLDGLGAGSIRAFELGNEPDLYASFTWYRTPSGQHVTGRPASYDMSGLIADFDRIASVLPGRPLAGPSLGQPGWMHEVPEFLAAAPHLGLVTLHRYPLQLCFTHRRSSRYPTVTNLMRPAASVGLADSFVPYVAAARAHGLSLRVDELNSVSCGADPGVSKTFASALWLLDTLFAMVRAGVHGVNIHTFPGAGYELFRVRRVSGRWQAAVAPEYYGMLMFARAAPAGARLLEVSDPGAEAVSAWATRAASGSVQVVAINRGTSARWLSVAVPGGRFAAGRLERLLASSLRARAGVTLAGRSFGARTLTGALAGSPRITVVAPRRGRYLILVPAASAGLLVLSPRGETPG